MNKRIAVSVVICSSNKVDIPPSRADGAFPATSEAGPTQPRSLSPPAVAASHTQ
jgi:hypothetical protein